MPGEYKYVKNTIIKRRAWIDSMKEGKPCADCGRDDLPTYCMDFHHRDPEEKRFTISKGSFRQSRENILIEIEKCDLLCAICHRIREYKEKFATRDGAVR